MQDDPEHSLHNWMLHLLVIVHFNTKYVINLIIIYREIKGRN